MRSITILCLSLLVAQQANAQFRCVENGKAIFQDRPCSTEVAPSVSKSDKVIGDSANTAYSTTNGTWRGQVQFMANADNTG